MTEQTNVGSHRLSTAVLITVIVCTTVVALALVGAWLYLEHQERATGVTLGQLLMWFAPILGVVGNLVVTGKLSRRTESIERNTNGNLHSERTLARAALAELPPPQARAILAESGESRPPQDPPRPATG